MGILSWLESLGSEDTRTPEELARLGISGTSFPDPKESERAAQFALSQDPSQLGRFGLNWQDPTVPLLGPEKAASLLTDIMTPTKGAVESIKGLATGNWEDLITKEPIEEWYNKLLTGVGAVPAVGGFVKLPFKSAKVMKAWKELIKVGEFGEEVPKWRFVMDVGNKLEETFPIIKPITGEMGIDMLPKHVDAITGKVTRKMGGLQKGSRIPAVGRVKLYEFTGSDAGELASNLFHEGVAHGLYPAISEFKPMAKRLWDEAPDGMKAAIQRLYTKEDGYTLADQVEEYFAFCASNAIRQHPAFAYGKSPFFNSAPKWFNEDFIRVLSDPNTQVKNLKQAREIFNTRWRDIKEGRATFSRDEIAKAIQADTGEKIVQKPLGAGITGSTQKSYSNKFIKEALEPRTAQEAVKETTSQRKRIKEVDMKGYTPEATSVKPMYGQAPEEVRKAEMAKFVDHIMSRSKIKDPEQLANLRELLEKSLLNK